MNEKQGVRTHPLDAKHSQTTTGCCLRKKFLQLALLPGQHRNNCKDQGSVGLVKPSGTGRAPMATAQIGAFKDPR